MLRNGFAVLLSICLVGILDRDTEADDTRYDVVVYGGTSAGVAAAIQAARMGRTTIVIEPGQHIGGLTSGGLGATDSGNKSVIGGISREFYRRVKQHYDNPAAWIFEERETYGRYRASDDAMWTFEPKVAEQIYLRMLAAHDIPIVRNERLNRQSGVARRGQRIVSITMESAKTYRGRMFIDATYEGDLMAAAGVSFTVGREPNSQYGETLNGVATKYNTHNHRFVEKVDPYVKPGDPSSGLLPGIHGDSPGEEGAGDHRIQAYCFRMCMSNVPANSVPFPKPEGYNELRYELLLRNFEAGDLRVPMHPSMMPNGKTDTNNNGAFSTDNLGMNYDYPEASYARREEIIREHEVYQKGLMWTLANHSRVPQQVRDWMSRWGLAKDEFVDNGNWPHQLYIREARRMVSDYVATELDCRRVRKCRDSVGLGSYNMDSHNVQRYVTPDGYAENEGDVQESPGGPYLISYRSIVPKCGEAQNLLVPVCVSSSHIAYGSIRMEPVFMILGQSAATAAVQAIDCKCSVQDVEYAALRTQLLKDGQVLDLPPGMKPKRLLRKSTIDGVVVDDEDAELTGLWSTSASIQPYVEKGYRHDGDQNKDRNRARFSAKLKPGRYQVLMSWSANANRASNLPVAIEHASGTATKTVNQRKPPRLDDGLFESLGTYEFDTSGSVAITCAGTDGHVILDAIVFRQAK
ncbi:MAG: FAD-dependent oxidoreductase [Planctomycetota bacterium]|jgi:hypothetical protein